MYHSAIPFSFNENSTSKQSPLINFVSSKTLSIEKDSSYHSPSSCSKWLTKFQPWGSQQLYMSKNVCLAKILTDKTSQRFVTEISHRSQPWRMLTCRSPFRLHSCNCSTMCRRQVEMGEQFIWESFCFGNSNKSSDDVTVAVNTHSFPPTALGADCLQAFARLGNAVMRSAVLTHLTRFL